MSQNEKAETVEEFLSRGGSIQRVSVTSLTDNELQEERASTVKPDVSCICCGRKKKHRIWCVYRKSSPCGYCGLKKHEPWCIHYEPAPVKDQPPRPAHSKAWKYKRGVCTVCNLEFTPPKRGFGRFVCQSCRQ